MPLLHMHIAMIQNSSECLNFFKINLANDGECLVSVVTLLLYVKTYTMLLVKK